MNKTQSVWTLKRRKLNIWGSNDNRQLRMNFKFARLLGAEKLTVVVPLDNKQPTAEKPLTQNLSEESPWCKSFNS